MRTTATEKIKEVNEKDFSYRVITDKGKGLFIEKKDLKGKTVNVGDELLIYINNADQIIGLDLNGERLYLYTEEQLRKKLEANNVLRECEQKHMKEKQDNFFASLPKLLQHRLTMFRMFDKNFQKEQEDYEAGLMHIGYLIFLVAKTEEGINQFARESWIEQVSLVPKLKTEDVSDHGFKFACYFAKCLVHDAKITDIKNPEIGRLKECLTMNISNAQAPLRGSCVPSGAIEKYIQNLSKL